jgi:type I site-specific restriction endonuclease
MTASDAAVVLFIFTLATVSADKPDANVATLQHAAWAVHAGPQRVDAVLVAVAGLVLRVGEPIAAQVERLNKARGELETLAKEIHDCWSLLRAQEETGFHRWDLELAQLQGEKVATRTTERQQAVQAQFRQLCASYELADLRFPQVRDPLRHIADLLTHDLTQDGLTELARLSSEVADSAPPLREALEDLENGFQELGNGLSPVAPACEDR